MRARIVEDRGCRVFERPLENYAGEVGMRSSDLEGKVGSQITADENDGGRRDVPCVPQVFQGRLGVFAPASFAGMHEAALPVAAVIECENIETGIVYRRKCVHRIAEVARLAVKVDGCKPRL